MAIFKRAFEPIVAEIENVKGEIVKLVSEKVLTTDVTEEIEKIGQNEGDGAELTGTKIILKQMIYVFGHDENFYKQFETSLLFDVMRWISSQIVHQKEKPKK